MRYILSLAIIAFCYNDFNAQTSPLFTWVNGANTVSNVGIFGTKGISGAQNIPGARENSMSWVDSNNDLWLLGGNGYSKSVNEGYLCDMWRYNISTNEWVWMSGDSSLNKHGSYGTKGVAAAGNYPGSRQNGVTWKDANGNLWLFGGEGFAATGGFGYLNDLWKYDVSANKWTWVSGANTANQTASYGILGVSSAANVPSARFGSCGWVDNQNNIWLFGGQTYTDTIKRLNDLWKYNLSTNQWTWVAGSDATNQNGYYGTKGFFSSSNIPGARQAGVSWTDNSGMCWLWGGYGFPQSGSKSYLNDLWKYDINSNKWAWISGDSIVNQAGKYGTKGTASSDNIPGARQMSVSWKDRNGDLWMFGGWGYVGPPFGRLNDLWKYDITLNQWMWVSGSKAVDQNGVYGAIGNSSDSNTPGSRRMSISWTDTTGKLWLFGGNGYDAAGGLGLLNDLWSIDIGISTSTNSFTQKQDLPFKYYPNPFNDEIIIDFADSRQHHIEVSDLNGRVLCVEQSKQKAIINLRNFDAGVYFIKCDSEIKKVIKQ